MLAAGLCATAMSLTPFADARFEPVNPARPDGPSIAVLHGDAATGPSDMLLLMPRGASPLHVHSADYRLVVLRGTMRHWGAGGREAAPDMEPGSYWFQPGGEAHSDECLSDECLMFITWSGPRDVRLATETEATR